MVRISAQPDCFEIIDGKWYALEYNAYISGGTDVNLLVNGEKKATILSNCSAVINAVAKNKKHIVYMLWGSFAQKKAEIVNKNENLVLTSAHPSPLSAYRGFFGNHHFSQANEYLVQNGESPINW